MKKLLLLLFLFPCFYSLAQDKLFMMNGDVLQVKYIETRGDDVIFTVEQDGTQKTKKLQVYQVSHVKLQNGKEQVFSRMPDRITLLSGTAIPARIVETNELGITYEMVTKRGKDIAVIDPSRIFSFTRNGKESVLYVPDSTERYPYSVEEMRYFVFGQQDALKNYRTPATSVFGFATGFAAGYFIDGLFPYVLATPLVYTSFHMLPIIRINRNTVSRQEYLKYPSYVNGYEKVARNKRVSNGFKSSLAGLAIGAATGLLVRPMME